MCSYQGDISLVGLLGHAVIYREAYGDARVEIDDANAKKSVIVCERTAAFDVRF